MAANRTPDMEMHDGAAPGSFASRPVDARKAARPRRPRRISASLIGALTLVAAAAGPALIEADRAVADSPSGVYLAARHAEARGDLKASAHYQRRLSHFDSDNDDLRRVAVLYSVLAGEMRAALRVARPLIDPPSDGRLALRVGIADAMRNGDYLRVVELVEIADDSLTAIERVLALGWAKYGLGEVAEAREIFAATDEPAVVKIVAGYHAGLLEAMEGDDRAALAKFEEAREASSGWSRRLGLAAAGAASRLGEREKAAAIYQDLRTGAPSDSAVQAAAARNDAGLPSELTVRTPAEGLAEIFYSHAIGTAAKSGGGDDQGRSNWIDDAREALFAARLAHHIAPDRGDAAVLVGDLLTALWQYDQAAEIFREAPADSPFYESARVGLASALAGAKKTDAALDVLRKTIADLDARPTTYFLLGELLNREKRYDECAEAYGEGVARLGGLDERDWVRVFELGICHAQRGDWDSAEAEFNRALALNPGQPDVLNYLGYSLVEMGIRIEEARQMIEEAVAARPKAGFIVDSLGWVLYRIGDFEGAVRELERAVELSPAEAVINDHYGDALWMVGRRMEARFQWKRALSFEAADEELDRDRVRRKLQIGLDEVLAEEEAAAAKGAAIGARAPGGDATVDAQNGG